MKHYIVITRTEKLNDYIQGRICGLIDGLSGLPDKVYNWTIDYEKNTETLPFECTDEQFQIIVKVIDDIYLHSIQYEFE